MASKGVSCTEVQEGYVLCLRWVLTCVGRIIGLKCGSLNDVTQITAFSDTLSPLCHTKTTVLRPILYGVTNALTPLPKPMYMSIGTLHQIKIVTLFAFFMASEKKKKKILKKTFIFRPHNQQRLNALIWKSTSKRDSDTGN